MIDCLHLSDLHLCATKTGWDADRILKHLVQDLQHMEQMHGLSPSLLLVTGDLAFGHLGKDELSIQAQFNEVAIFLKKVRSAFKQEILAERVFIVPGNHDVVRDNILISQTKYLDDLASGDYIQSIKCVNQLLRDASDEWSTMMRRLDAYRKFLEEHYPHLLQDERRLCYAHTLEIDDLRVGIVGLNSAWSCGRDQEKGKLWLGGQWQIRTLRKQLGDTDIALAITHHPLSWLVAQENPLLDPELQQEFDFFFHGHEHQAWVEEKPCHVRFAAGACYGETPMESGYSLVRLSSVEGRGEVWLRRFSDEGLGWIPRVVPGRTNNNGQWLLDLAWLKSEMTLESELPTIPDETFYENVPASTEELPTASDHKSYKEIFVRASNLKIYANDAVDVYLSRELHKALSSFSSQPKVWVEPILFTHAEVDRNSAACQQVLVQDLISSHRSIIIKAPPQFGLTCLARHLVLQAWRLNSRERWVYLDVRALKPNANNINRAISVELSHTGHVVEDASCIIVDACQLGDKGVSRILKNICEIFRDIRILIMQTVDIRTLLGSSIENIGRDFDVRYLWALSREHIREVVAAYNEARHIGDEDLVISRIVNDMDTLNIHRTPLNCLTVLKASEVDFSESPVNRTEMLGRILFLLFNVDSLPSYKLRPDMKDCEYVLGYFCEQLIRNDYYSFSREQFIRMLHLFCEYQVMVLEIEMLFDILYANHILVPFGSCFCFRFTYWLYYFAAQRMHHDKEFAEYILSDTRYTRFPELIEFYTGIDRRRADALKILTEDLHQGIEMVRQKLGLPDELNPYPYIQWHPSPIMLEKMKNEIANGVAASNLPEVIKDRYADRTYDRSRPYDQSIRNTLAIDTLGSMMISICAAARALRNSDYVKPESKKELLKEILAGWKQVQKVLWILVPFLSEKGDACFDGARFIIGNDFGNDTAERLRAILGAIPYNIVCWYQDDLYSPKMAPLLFRQVSNELDDIVKHNLIILLISKRPQGWKECIEQYIFSAHKNSFYLFDAMRYLRLSYEYAFASAKDLRDMEYLIKMCASKHQGAKHPGKKAVNKISDSVLPERNIKE